MVKPIQVSVTISDRHVVFWKCLVFLFCTDVPELLLSDTLSTHAHSDTDRFLHVSYSVMQWVELDLRAFIYIFLMLQILCDDDDSMSN